MFDEMMTARPKKALHQAGLILNCYFLLLLFLSLSIVPLEGGRFKLSKWKYFKIKSLRDSLLWLIYEKYMARYGTLVILKVVYLWHPETAEPLPPTRCLPLSLPGSIWVCFAYYPSARTVRNLWDPVQNEDVGVLVKNLLRISRQQQRSIKPVLGLCCAQGPMRPALPHA